MGGKVVNAALIIMLLMAALIMALVMLPRTVAAQGRPAVVIISGAGLYELPARSLGMKVEVPRQTPVQVLDQKGSWYVVRVADLVGWMQKYTLSVKQSTSSSSRASVEKPPSKSSSKSTSIPSNRTYVLTLKGNCYYWSQAGQKVFVDRSICS